MLSETIFAAFSDRFILPITEETHISLLLLLFRYQKLRVFLFDGRRARDTKKRDYYVYIVSNFNRTRGYVISKWKNKFRRLLLAYSRG